MSATKLPRSAEPAARRRGPKHARPTPCSYPSDYPPLALARCRRCFALSFPLRLLARLALLDFGVLIFIRGSSRLAIVHFYRASLPAAIAFPIQIVLTISPLYAI
jgi:hypothetical protein